MNYSVIEIFGRSVTIELEGESPYFQEQPYEIYVNGAFYGSDSRNVVTIDGLEPASSYSIRLVSSAGECEQVITTEAETILMDVHLFGARGDGIHMDTASIQAALYSCPEGGTVHFKEGTYLTGPLFLKSGITLWLDEGARILGSPDRKDYPVLPGMIIPPMGEGPEYNLGSWEGNPLDTFASLITGICVKNVDIVGRGSIDGGADAGDWWKHPKEKIGAWRPRTIFLSHCSRVRLQGIRVCNSPSWTVHPYYCDGVRALNLTIWNPDNSPNTDGFDPESCTDVLVAGTEISVGDDCIAIKSGKYYMSQYHFRRTAGVEVRNCRLMRGHGSVTLGSEVACGVEKVRVSKCLFVKTDRGIRLKTRRGRGQKSCLNDLFFENIIMEDVHMPLTVNMFYYCDPDGHSDYVQNQAYRPADEMTPSIGTIRMRGIECTGVDASFVCACGLPEMPIEGIVLENIRASFRPAGERKPKVPVMMDGFPELSGVSLFLKNIDTVKISDVQITGAEDIAPTIENVQKLQMDNLYYLKE